MQSDASKLNSSSGEKGDGHGSSAIKHCMYEPEVTLSPEGSPSVEDRSTLNNGEWFVVLGCF